MKISKEFKLSKTQAELDFIDIDTTKDTPLFLDPFFLSLKTDKWSTECTRSIKIFFQTVLAEIKANRISEAKKLFQNLHEPNATCLGLSKGIPKGRGVGRENTNDIFESIISSKAVQSGLVKDLEDNVLFVEGFGKDKLSDMTTNIIRLKLIEYTQAQCKLHQIELRQNIPSGFYWNVQSRQWEQQLTEMLVVNGKVILLVPKGAASYSADYASSQYYQHFVLNFMQNEHLKLDTSFVQKRKDGSRYVTKKSLIEKYPYSKEFLTDYTSKYPEILKDFKRKTNISSLSNFELGSENVRALAIHLSQKLAELPAGNENATKFHRLITGILELIFYPSLIYPMLEQEIHSGRKRIDLTFDNAASDGIFYRLHKSMKLPCQYIFIECKNYSTDPANPEIDQLAGRFSPNRGQVGFLVCRTAVNINLLLDRCKDTYRDERGLIIPLTDSDLISFLQNYDNWNHDFIDRFLSSRIRDIMVN